MTRQKVEFATNAPVQLILASDGVLQPSSKGYGDEYRYFFEGDQVTWAKPELHAAIQAAGIHTGDECIITRAERREGNRRRVEWQVEKLEDEPGADTAHSDSRPALPPPPPVRDPRQTAADLEAEKEAAANYAYYGAPIGAPPANGSNGTGKPATPPAPPAAPPAKAHPAELPITPADAQAAALCAAIDAALAAEAYATAHGYPLRFTSEDIRTMANTIRMGSR